MRQANDAYPTPIGFVRPSIAHLVDGRYASSGIDVAAGNGVFGNELRSHVRYLLGTDLSGQPPGWKGISWRMGDFLSMKFTAKYDYIVCNPPFSLMEQFLPKLRSLMHEDSRLGVFARLTLLEGKKRFVNLWSQWKPGRVVVFDDRIHSFGGSDNTGRAFIVWNSWSASDTKLVWEKVNNG